MTNDVDDQIGVSHGISTFGNLNCPEDYRHFGIVNPDAPNGGEFSTWGSRTFGTFNPFVVNGKPEGSSTIAIESLMIQSHEWQKTVHGLLAEKIALPKADRQWTE